ncbi:MBL fold metallo-hydrolase [Candidatus Saganbacteria bacterium]|nr:MBL fold metallo-hydrolase [Candidatus Saganbacteria bacterium]
MEIETIKVGHLQTNCYIVKDGNEALVIDPGFEAKEILPHLGDVKVLAIILTHGHYDHVTEAFKLKEGINFPIYIHKDDDAMMAYTTGLRADKFLKDNSTFVIGNLTFDIIHTPGHTLGGICLYNKKEHVLFSGDTLFKNDYGRIDLPGSSQDQMEESLKKLQKLPPETRVYPGHGDPTTIGDEKDLII